MDAITRFKNQHAWLPTPIASPYPNAVYVITLSTPAALEQRYGIFFNTIRCGE